MSKTIRVMHAVGARPNFMKAAPLIAAMASRTRRFHQTLVHTGQHYDSRMSDRFFLDLDLPDPDEHLGIGSGSHAQQTARILIAFEETLLARKPDRLFVYGDVNSTLACALAASKLGVPTAHVEAGLRSFDRTMPEEWNRLLTDRMSDLLFTTEISANDNLAREGFASSSVHFVGNLMIDTLVRLLPKAGQTFPDLSRRLGLTPRQYVLVTLHRPSNVDLPERLRWILDGLDAVARLFPVVFPVHPRTQAALAALGGGANRRLQLLEPLGYLEFLALQSRAAMVLTDSGGVQEETCWLGIPCLTLRSNTERPVTLEIGTNRLVDFGTPLLEQVTDHLHRSGGRFEAPKPPLWDGRAATRIADVLCQVEASGAEANDG